MIQRSYSAACWTGIVLFLLTFIYPAATANAQSAGQQAEEADRLFDASRMQTVSGNFIRFEKTIADENRTHGIRMLLDTDDGIVTVHLGPMRFIDSLDLKMDAGDAVTVKGSLIELEGKPILIAATVHSGDDVYKLRDTAGIPVWSGWRRAKSDVGGHSNCALDGVVLDSSGASIPDAVVLLEPGHESVSTGIDGSYCFEQVDPATNELRVTADGFDERISRIQLSEGRPTTLNLVLVPAEMKEIVYVTAATRTVKTLEEVPVRTEVILPELIGMSASRNLADAVEYNTGLRVENNCQNCNFSQIRMLGLQGNYTQILFDGQPTLSSLAQVYGIEQIPARMVERVEVVKGGGSSIYGPGSVGGIVNVISHIPERTSGYLLGRLGWMNGVPDQTFSASADWTSAGRGSTVTVFGQMDKVHPLDLDGDGFTEVSKRNFKAAGARYRQSLLSQKAELTFDFNHFREDRRGGDLLNLPPHEANIAEAISSRRSAGGVSWRHTPSAKFDYHLTLSLAQMNRDTYYGGGKDPNAYGKSDNPMWVIDSQFNHFFVSHILSWGAQITADGVQDTQHAYNRVYDETYRNVGFFVQDDWFLFPNFEVVYGFRIDKHSEIDKGIFSPRVAMKWTLNPNLNLRASMATGFQPPQVFDEDLHITVAGGEGQVIRNNPDLKEESSTTFSAGVEWKPNWGKGVGLVEFNFFHTGLRDLFNVVESDDPGTDEQEFTRINFGKASVYGAEVNFGYAVVPDIEVQVGYVEQRSRFDEPESDFGSKEFFRTPNRYGLVTAMYRNPRFLDLFFGARYTGEMKAPHYAGYIAEDRLETTPAHWILDASASKEFSFGADSNVIVTVGGKNLTDYYQDDLDQGPNRDSGYVWGPRFPRTVYVSTAVEF